MEMTIQESPAADHAALAMQAAKKVRRARRQSQKEKMGHAVCHHLLCMLNREPEPSHREKRLARPLDVKGMEKAEPLDARDDGQLSIGF